MLLNRFQITEFLGAGGMGEVYSARDQCLEGKEIAVKTLRNELSGDPRLASRFTKEVLMARSVSHPNLCPIYDLFETEFEGRPLLFLTMRKYEGETLRKRLDGDSSLPPALRLNIVKQICDGLDAAHSGGIIHGASTRSVRASDPLAVAPSTEDSTLYQIELAAFHRGPPNL